MSETKHLEARIDALETQVAFQEQTIEDLNKAISDQWSEFGKMNREITKLQSHLEEVEASTGGTDIIDRPPHY